MRAGISPAAVVLAASYAGFGALAQQVGLGVFQTVFIGVAVWALPSQILLISEMALGTAMLAAAFGVTLTAVRLMPLTVTLMPVVGGEAQPKWARLLAAHFCAVTTWVEAMRRLPSMALAERMPFYLGMVAFLTVSNSFAAVAGYYMAGSLGATVSACLLFLTPIYFLLSMTSASPGLTNRLALAIGLALGPVVYVLLPGFDLLIPGLVGGTAAYFLGRKLERR